MLWFIRFIASHRNVSSLIFTVLLSLLMLRADASQQQRIARALTLTVFYPFQFTVTQVTRARNIFAENKRLKSKLTDVMVSNALLKEKVAENERIRKLLSFVDNTNYKLISARVIAREPSQLYRSFVINAGKDKGIELYMPVVTQDGLVGKIMQVLPKISLVQLLKDPSARTSVMIEKNRSVGILETDTGNRFFILYRNHVDVNENDTIITSGLGGIFPGGLNMGVVSAITKSHDPLFKRVYCDLAVDFDHIEEIFVLKLSPQWLRFREELDSVEFAQ